MCYYSPPYKKKPKKAKDKKGSDSEYIDCIKYEAETLPDSFHNWLHEKVFKDKYMYYRKESAGSYFGYCSCGADEIPLSSVRGGQYITCPVCGDKVRLKHDIYNHYETDRQIVFYLQATSKGWMQRIFACYKRTSYCRQKSPRTEVKYYIDEEQRDHLSFDGYYWKYHPYKDHWRTGPGTIHGMGYGRWIAENEPAKTYPHNIDALFVDSEYKYSILKDVAENMDVNPFWWLADYLKFPQMEFLIKLKLYKFALDFYCSDESNYYYSDYGINKKGKNIKEIIGLETKADIEFAASHNLSAKQIRAYNLVKKWKNTPQDMDAINFMYAVIDRSGTDFKYSFISSEKFFNYYNTLKDKYKIRDFLSDYSDYINAAIYLKMDTTDTKVKTPHDFKYAHDVCIARSNEARARQMEKDKKKKAAAEKRGYKKIFAELNKKFTYADKKYQIIVPATSDDIKAEGKAQGHCVGGYVQSVIDGYSIIVFLRKTAAPDVPFFTAEISPKTYDVVQCRTKGNAPAPPEIEKWMNRYVKRIKEKLLKKVA